MHQKDQAMTEEHIDESPARKSLGAWIVAMALGVTAASTTMPWWGALLVGLGTWYGLHKVAGLKIKWSYGGW
jgi:hypothetical protein